MLPKTGSHGYTDCWRTRSANDSYQGTTSVVPIRATTAKAHMCAKCRKCAIITLAVTGLFILCGTPSPLRNNTFRGRVGGKFFRSESLRQRHPIVSHAGSVLSTFIAIRLIPPVPSVVGGFIERSDKLNSLPILDSAVGSNLKHFQLAFRVPVSILDDSPDVQDFPIKRAIGRECLRHADGLVGSDINGGPSSGVSHAFVPRYRERLLGLIHLDAVNPMSRVVGGSLPKVLKRYIGGVTFPVGRNHYFAAVIQQISAKFCSVGFDRCVYLVGHHFPLTIGCAGITSCSDESEEGEKSKKTLYSKMQVGLGCLLACLCFFYFPVRGLLSLLGFPLESKDFGYGFLVIFLSLCVILSLAFFLVVNGLE